MSQRDATPDTSLAEEPVLDQEPVEPRARVERLPSPSLDRGKIDLKDPQKRALIVSFGEARILAFAAVFHNLPSRKNASCKSFENLGLRGVIKVAGPRSRAASKVGDGGGGMGPPPELLTAFKDP